MARNFIWMRIGETASRLGIDVSEYQPEVNWQQVKDYGVDFGDCAPGGIEDMEKPGSLVEDSMFRSHVEGALTAGLGCGACIFLLAGSQSGRS